MKSPNSRIAIDLDTVFFDFVEGFQSDPDTALDSLSLLLLDPVTCRARIEKLRVDASYSGLNNSAADSESSRAACDMVVEKGLFAAFNDGSISSMQLVSIASNPNALRDLFCRLWPDDVPLPPEFAEAEQPLSTPKAASSDTVRFGAEGSETRLGECPKDAFEDCRTQLATLWNHPGHVAQQVSQIAKAVDDWSRSGNLDESDRLELRTTFFSTLNRLLSNRFDVGFWIDDDRFARQIRTLIEQSVSTIDSDLLRNNQFRLDPLVRSLEKPLQQAVQDAMVARAVAASLLPEEAAFYWKQVSADSETGTHTTSLHGDTDKYSMTELESRVVAKLRELSCNGE